MIYVLMPAKSKVYGNLTGGIVMFRPERVRVRGQARREVFTGHGKTQTDLRLVLNSARLVSLVILQELGGGVVFQTLWTENSIQPGPV